MARTGPRHVVANGKVRGRLEGPATAAAPVWAAVARILTAPVTELLQEQSDGASAGQGARLRRPCELTTRTEASRRRGRALTDEARPADSLRRAVPGRESKTTAACSCVALRGCVRMPAVTRA